MLRKPRLWATHPPTPRGDSDPRQVPRVPPRASHPGADHKAKCPHLSTTPSPGRGSPTSLQGPPGKCQCGAQVSFPVVRTVTYLPWVGSFPPTHCYPQKCPALWPHACVLLTAALKEPHRRNGRGPQRGSLTTHQSVGCSARSDSTSQ